MPRSHIEGQILRKFERSLKKAIERHEEYGWEDIDSIARQKLLVQAIRHFGLGDYVTIQWFKDGDVLTGLDNHDTEVDITDAGVNEGPIPDEEDIISYFKNGTSEMPLDAILGVDDRKEWLKSYYHFHEEIPFEQIYLNGMQIHLHI